MSPRTILSVARGETVTMTGSVIVTGDVSEGAKLEIRNGNLQIKGRVQMGATVKAYGDVSVRVAIGPDTVIESDHGKLIVGFVIGSVKLISRAQPIVTVSVSRDIAKFYMPSCAKLFFNKATLQTPFNLPKDDAVRMTVSMALS